MGIRRLGSLVGALVMVVVACAPAAAPGSTGKASEPPKPTAPKQMTAAIFGVPPSLDFRFVVSSNNAGYNEMAGLYKSKLTVYNDDGILVPQLAEAAPTQDNGLWKLNSDNTMETRLTIKPGVLWHDGTP